MKHLLFDDRRADGWNPFALSRPVGELRFGALLQRERMERWAGSPVEGHVTRPWLDAYAEHDAPPAREPGDVDPGRERLFVSSRLVPSPEAEFTPPDGPALLVADGEPAGCFLPEGTATPDRAWFSRPSELPGASVREVEGRLLEAVWELVRDGAGQTGRDVVAWAPEAARTPPSGLPEGVWTRGGGRLFLEEGARVEPGTLLDTSDGPIWLARDVEVRSGSRLAGPLYAGPGSRLLGGPVEALAAGPVSYLRGEVSEITTLGYVNKAHLGFLGHAYLGRWVNLGAATTNSDLKNNYGPVRIGGPEGPVETGLLKLGALLGDHVRTAIGTTLGTGTVVGAGSNVFGDGTPPRWVPPFAWGGGDDPAVYRKEAFLETAETVLGRRGVPFEDGTARWLSAVWEEARRRSAEDGGGGPA